MNNSGYEDKGLAYIANDNEAGHINMQGEIIIHCRYDFIMAFKNGLAGVSKNNEFGYINKKGEIAVPLEYDFCWPFVFVQSNPYNLPVNNCIFKKNNDRFLIIGHSISKKQLIKKLSDENKHLQHRHS